VLVDEDGNIAGARVGNPHRPLPEGPARKLSLEKADVPSSKSTRASEWELREPREREEERRVEAEELGAEGEEQPLFLPFFMASVVCSFFCLSFVFLL
jgi:hypothetical protein